MADFDITQNEKISPRQFSGLAKTINSGGGFSFKVAGADKGHAATSGYMVGQPGRGADFKGRVSGRTLSDYTDRNMDLLGQPAHYLGGWQGSKPKRASVDVAKKFPMGQKGSRSAAKYDAARSNQEAVGMVDADADYAGDITNPNYVEGRGHSLRQPTMRDASWAFGRGQQAGPVEPPRATSSSQAKIPKKR